MERNYIIATLCMFSLTKSMAVSIHLCLVLGTLLTCSVELPLVMEIQLIGLARWKAVIPPPPSRLPSFCSLHEPHLETN